MGSIGVGFCKDCIHLTKYKNCELVGTSPNRITTCLVKMTKEELQKIQKSQVTDGKSKKTS